jgi:hypothetical protein
MISGVLAAGLLAVEVSAQAATKPLTNDDVASLAKAGLEENTIITAVRAQDSSFDISAPALLKLKQDGVTTKILSAIVTATSKQRRAAPVS